MKIVQLTQLPTEPVSHDPAIGKRVMLRKGDVPHLTCFGEARFPPGSRTTHHLHADMYEIFFVQQGEGVMEGDAGEVALSPGLCIAVAPNGSHPIRNCGAEELVLLYFGVTI